MEFFAIKTEIVKATGIVQSVNKNYVMAPYAGEITDINVVEGQHVEAEEIIFIIKSTDVDLQVTQLSEQKVLYEKQISQNEKLIKSIKEDENYFSSFDPDDSLYYSQYELYKSQISQQSVDADAYRQFGYSEEQIEAELIKSQAKIAEIYHAAIQAAESVKLQAQIQLSAISAQLMALQQGKEGYSVVATISGKIHMLGEYKEGMLVQAGGAIASIASEQDEYIIIANIGVQDIARINHDDIVDIAVVGLHQSQNIIYENIKDLMSNKIVKSTSHSLCGAPRSDTILLLNNGYLVEQGTHESLINSNGEYAYLYNLQMDSY